MFGIGLDVDPNSSTFLQPFLDRTSEIALTADADLAVDGTAGIGGFSIDIVGGIVKLSDEIDLGNDGMVGGMGGDPDDFGGPAKLGLGLSDPNASDKGIFFSEIGLSIFDPILMAELLVNLPIEANGNPLGEIFALVSIQDFTDFDVQISGLDADLIDEILNGLTELSLENIIAGMRFIFDTAVDGLQSDLIGQLPLIGDDLQLIGAFLEELDTRFLTPVEDFITNTLAGAAEDILEQLQKVGIRLAGAGADHGRHLWLHTAGLPDTGRKLRRNGRDFVHRRPHRIHRRGHLRPARVDFSGCGVRIRPDVRFQRDVLAAAGL